MLEQLPLDRGHPGGAGLRRPQLARPPRRGRRSSAGSTTGRRRASSSRLARQLQRLRDVGAVGGQQLGQPVHAVDAGRALPGEVVETDVVELDPFGGDAQVAGERALEADGHVAQPDRSVPRLEQGAGDDADRVGEVDDPGVGRGCAAPARRCRAPPGRCAGPSRAHRRRWSPARRSRTPAARSRPACGRPDRPPAAGAGRRRRLRAPGLSSVRWSAGRPGWPRRAEDPAAEGADQLQPVGGRDRRAPAPRRAARPQCGRPVDELRGVRRAAADDCDLHSGLPGGCSTEERSGGGEERRGVLFIP